MSDVAHTDALAAEYVLGTLDSDEREQARALLGTDAAFAVKVSQWERRLGELHLMVEPVEPDAGIWARIKSKMPDVQQRSNVHLPEAHIPEPAPAAVPTEAPSLDAIEATISETALALTSEATAAPAQEPAEAPASEAVAAATLETIERPISEVDALIWGTTEASVQEPTAEAAPVSVLEPPAADLDAAAMPGPPESILSVPEGTATATLDVTPAPAWHATPTPAAVVEPVVVPPPVPPSSPVAIVPTPEATRRMDETARQVAVIGRRLRRWRAFALLMTLVVAAVAALLAAWKFAPERVPPMLQPSEVLRHVGVTPRAAGPLRRPLPPPSHLEE
jgi:anti-sigma-K factor RskA